MRDIRSSNYRETIISTVTYAAAAIGTNGRRSSGLREGAKGNAAIHVPFFYEKSVEIEQPGKISARIETFDNEGKVTELKQDVSLGDSIVFPLYSSNGTRYLADHRSDHPRYAVLAKDTAGETFFFEGILNPERTGTNLRVWDYNNQKKADPNTPIYQRPYRQSYKK